MRRKILLPHYLFWTTINFWGESMQYGEKLVKTNKHNC